MPEVHRSSPRLDATARGSRVDPCVRADLFFDLEFDVPADAPGADLTADPARWWELAIEARRPAGARARFHAPVMEAGRRPV